MTDYFSVNGAHPLKEAPNSNSCLKTLFPVISTITFSFQGTSKETGTQAEGCHVSVCLFLLNYFAALLEIFR